MSGLLNKINTLFRARIENFLEEDLHLTRNRDRRELLSADQLGQDIDREVTALRQRIEQAITHEEKLQTEIDALRQEASDWDLQADNALLKGDEVTARHALAQMKRTEQKAALLEADLVQHHRSTAEFIERVNVLEGLVAEARSQQQSAPPPSTGKTLDTVLHTTRIEVETLEEGKEPPSAVAQERAQEQDEVAATRDDDDLAARRARLARHNPVKEE
jgi:phage shock protein A